VEVSLGPESESEGQGQAPHLSWGKEVPSLLVPGFLSLFQETIFSSHGLRQPGRFHPEHRTADTLSEEKEIMR